MKHQYVNVCPAEPAPLEWILGVVALIFLLGLSFQPAAAHDPEVDRGEDKPDYAERLARVRYLQQHKMSEGLRHRAALKVQRAALEAAGLPSNEVARRLFRGPAFAFPYVTPPELSSKGTVRTLTVLVDFKDHRADNTTPNLKSFIDNIFGNGTQIAQNHKPYESVHAYYNRASEGMVDLQGDVLDWYHMPKNRKEYEPTTAPPGPDRDYRQMVLDNKALFAIAREVLSAQDATHDYSQYDNDNDGDIDSLTILYAGPNGGWYSFWWAYRWEFFVPEANTVRFDGKRLKQFVFQFIDVRDPITKDFNPKTLIHETGHAFGLADYYDYKPKIGPPGGVGGLDMMAGNMGNHCAFSRWLLDWIKPEVIGSGAPLPKDLLASGLTGGTGAKAIAIFPELTDTDAPSGEMFIIENRLRVGNDGHSSDTPGEGLLIWHVDATVNADNNDFKYDNSETDHKLIKLIRADSKDDFGQWSRASAKTYFKKGHEFTPFSAPDSSRINGKPSNVSVTEISETADVMSAKVGFAGAPAAPPRLAASSAGRTAAEHAEKSIDLEKLYKFNNKLATETPADIKKRWQRSKSDGAEAADTGQATLKKQAILISWASKSGKEAVEALLAVPDESFVRRTFPEVMAAWVANNPSETAKWYFAEEQIKIRNVNKFPVSDKFIEKVFTYAAPSDQKQVLMLLDSFNNKNDIRNAVTGIRKALALQGIDLSTSKAAFKTLKKNKAFVDKLDNKLLLK